MISPAGDTISAARPVDRIVPQPAACRLVGTADGVGAGEGADEG